MSDLIQEVLHEITGEPLRFAVEFVQFVLLVVIIRYLVRRSVGTHLTARRDRIAAEVQKANQADTAYSESQRRASLLVTEARDEARRTVEAARIAADAERQAGLEQAEQEANDILLQAQQTIDTEKNRVGSEASEELISLITMVSRRYIEESLTESERRTVTQKLISASLKEMENASSHH
jgi:F-type H+-transporting ATPase subunit b